MRAGFVVLVLVGAVCLLAEANSAGWASQQQQQQRNKNKPQYQNKTNSSSKSPKVDIGKMFSKKVEKFEERKNECNQKTGGPKYRCLVKAYSKFVPQKKKACERLKDSKQVDCKHELDKLKETLAQHRLKAKSFGGPSDEEFEDDLAKCRKEPTEKAKATCRVPVLKEWRKEKRKKCEIVKNSPAATEIQKQKCRQALKQIKERLAKNEKTADGPDFTPPYKFRKEKRKCEKLEKKKEIAACKADVLSRQLAQKEQKCSLLTGVKKDTCQAKVARLEKKLAKMNKLAQKPKLSPAAQKLKDKLFRMEKKANATKLKMNRTKAMLKKANRNVLTKEERQRLRDVCMDKKTAFKRQRCKFKLQRKVLRQKQRACKQLPEGPLKEKCKAKSLKLRSKMLNAKLRLKDARQAKKEKNRKKTLSLKRRLGKSKNADAKKGLKQKMKKKLAKMKKMKKKGLEKAKAKLKKMKAKSRKMAKAALKKVSKVMKKMSAKLLKKKPVNKKLAKKQKAQRYKAKVNMYIRRKLAHRLRDNLLMAKANAYDKIVMESNALNKFSSDKSTKKLLDPKGY